MEVMIVDLPQIEVMVVDPPQNDAIDGYWSIIDRNVDDEGC